MRVILLSCYPLVDKLDYKCKVLTGLVSRKPEALSLVYVNTRFIDYYREFRKRYRLKDLFYYSSKGKGNILSYRSQGVETLAEKLGVDVLMAKSFNKKCIDYLSEFGPDIIHNLSGLYIPKAVLRIPRYGVIGGHYGALPKIRGSDTIRWTILLNHLMVVSHMFLASKLDMGDILLKMKVDVNKGDDIKTIRGKCQEKNAVGHLVIYDRISCGILKPVKQGRNEGSTFFRMGFS